MANFTIVVNIPDDKVIDVRDTLCSYWNYTGEAKKAFIDGKVKNFLKESYILGKRKAQEDAAEALIEQAGSDAGTIEMTV